ncbi:hypothetical protein [uncultured Chryseobacterium sp.]|uniref:hypothetical protein n=1 Tax=uncultured Chryseobacterium sp. TaxID=259322 RepID=UPI0025CB8D6B|nr:hypothetical protein [uncultured Chryseobacterium sp.]
MKLIELYKAAIDSLFTQLRSIDRFMVKSDEQDIADLLSNEKDKIEYQKKIDQMVRENIKQDTIKIKNRNITISL